MVWYGAVQYGMVWYIVYTMQCIQCPYCFSDTCVPVKSQCYITLHSFSQKVLFLDDFGQIPPVLGHRQLHETSVDGTCITSICSQPPVTLHTFDSKKLLQTTDLKLVKTARGRFETNGVTLYHRDNRFILNSSKFNVDT